jgi:topoisomerase-4 subunit A
VYSLPAHSLPSARGLGEPLSGKLNPPDGARFTGAMIGEPEDLWLIASDAGYGFTVRLKELHSRNRAGKGCINLTAQALVLPAVPVPDPGSSIALVNNDGRLLVIKAADVPELARGKGNKLFGIPTKKALSREEILVALAALADGQSLKVWSGERHMTLAPKDLDAFRGERAQRGAVLPRGWRTVNRLEPVLAGA